MKEKEKAPAAPLNNIWFTVVVLLILVFVQDTYAKKNEQKSKIWFKLFKKS